MTLQIIPEGSGVVVRFGHIAMLAHRCAIA